MSRGLLINVLIDHSAGEFNDHLLSTMKTKNDIVPALTYLSVS